MEKNEIKYPLVLMTVIEKITTLEIEVIKSNIRTTLVTIRAQYRNITDNKNTQTKLFIKYLIRFKHYAHKIYTI